MFREQTLKKGGVFALGNFDGVHRGHRLVVETAVAQAHAMNAPARVLTFEPHPRMLFQPDAAPFQLTSLENKTRLLSACGASDVVVLPFTEEFSELTAEDFVEKVLVEHLRAEHIVAGHDFVFGHKRGGDMQKLAAWLSSYKVGVSEVAPLGQKTGAAFSSTHVRHLLQQGEVGAAGDILGRDWSITGTVIKGAQRGRTIGVPTANIGLGEYLRPRFGVYAIRAGRIGEPLNWRGVANIGIRPTVGGISENLEAHLFDFDQDIYGQDWEFALTRFIRPEQKFESFDALKAQIALDMAAAR